MSWVLSIFMSYLRSLLLISTYIFLTKRIHAGYTKINFLRTAVFLLFLSNLFAKRLLLFPHVRKMTSIIPTGLFNWPWLTIYTIFLKPDFPLFLSPTFWNYFFCQYNPLFVICLYKHIFTPIFMTVYIFHM